MEETTFTSTGEFTGFLNHQQYDGVFFHGWAPEPTKIVVRLPEVIWPAEDLRRWRISWIYWATKWEHFGDMGLFTKNLGNSKSSWVFFQHLSMASLLIGILPAGSLQDFLSAYRRVVTVKVFEIMAGQPTRRPPFLTVPRLQNSGPYDHGLWKPLVSRKWPVQKPVGILFGVTWLTPWTSPEIFEGNSNFENELKLVDQPVPSWSTTSHGFFTPVFNSILPGQALKEAQLAAKSFKVWAVWATSTCNACQFHVTKKEAPFGDTHAKR